MTTPLPVCLCGQSAAVRQIVALVEKVAPLQSNVMIIAEDGASARDLARLIHESGASPESALIDAMADPIGGVHAALGKAQGGTLFVENAESLGDEDQLALLRLLNRTPSSQRPRIVAATRNDLKEALRSGRIREELYYRLNVVEIRIPPLRRRREDIPAVVDALLKEISGDLGKDVHEISPEALGALARHEYSGDLAELRSMLERVVTLAVGSRIDVHMLPAALDSTQPDLLAGEPITAFPDSGVDLEAHLAAYERRIIEMALAKGGRVKKQTARLLGLSFRSLRYRLEKLGLDAAEDGDE